MANKTYIVRFDDEKSCNEFYETLKSQNDVEDKRIALGEFIPYFLIIYDVSDIELKKLNQIAGNKARFFPDFEHNLF